MWATGGSVGSGWCRIAPRQLVDEVGRMPRPISLRSASSPDFVEGGVKQFILLSQLAGGDGPRDEGQRGLFVLVPVYNVSRGTWNRQARRDC